MGAKVLVVGGTGLVGNALLRTWTARGSEVAAATFHRHAAGGFLQLDMQDEPGVRALLGRLKPSVVAVPAAGVAAEAIAAFEIALAMREKFAGDSLREMKDNFDRYVEHLRLR